MTDSVLGLTRRAGDWFLRSGIQDGQGGVARYFRSDLGVKQPVSTEITGYAASTMVWLHKLAGEPEYLEAAVAAARFLVQEAWDPAIGTFPFELGDGDPRRSYFFDCGIIARGLLAVGRATGDAIYTRIAEACGRAMARDFAAGGEFHAVLALPQKTPVAGDGRWSRNPGCYQLKAAMAWFELFEETGDEEFLRSYETALAYSLRTHRSFLESEPEQERVMDRLHAYAYFLEGLLPVVERPECAAAMAEGIEKMAGRLRDIAPVFERSDVYAQLLRLRLFTGAPGNQAEQYAARIAGFQLNDGDPRTGGGFCFGQKRGMLLPFVNPASTAFCIQALEMWRQYRAGLFAGTWTDLV